MRRGAFAMLDALGFRGIWKRTSAEKIIARLESLRTAANGAVDTMFGGDRQLVIESQFNALKDVKLSFLSDTIVIGLEVKSELRALSSREHRDQLSVYLATLVVGAVLQQALAEEPRLIFRGCITLGDYKMSDTERFIVGEAVDRSAELHERAQGAFVWLAPEALAAIAGPTLQVPAVVPAAIQYDVPMKGGDVYNTLAVFPYAPAATASERLVAKERTIETFKTSSSFDVAIKMQNTIRFLDRADTLLGAEQARLSTPPSPLKPDSKS